jgi:hypothetical protein
MLGLTRKLINVFLAPVVTASTVLATCAIGHAAPIELACGWIAGSSWDPRSQTSAPALYLSLNSSGGGLDITGGGSAFRAMLVGHPNPIIFTIDHENVTETDGINVLGHLGLGDAKPQFALSDVTWTDSGENGSAVMAIDRQTGFLYYKNELSLKGVVLQIKVMIGTCAPNRPIF